MNELTVCAIGGNPMKSVVDTRSQTRWSRRVRLFSLLALLSAAAGCITHDARDNNGGMQSGTPVVENGPLPKPLADAPILISWESKNAQDDTRETWLRYEIVRSGTSPKVRVATAVSIQGMSRDLLSLPEESFTLEKSGGRIDLESIIARSLLQLQFAYNGTGTGTVRIAFFEELSPFADGYGAQVSNMLTIEREVMYPGMPPIR